jgi:hypothetical protein
MSRKTRIVAMTLGAGLAGCASLQGEATPVRYIDAHSHVVPAMTTAQEIALFRNAGVDAVIIMNPDPAVLTDFAAQGAGYVTPFVSLARLNQMTGLRLDADAPAAFAALHASGAVCGFGELPTRLEGANGISDAVSLANPLRGRIYDLANARGLPVNIHVSLESPEVIAAVEQIVAGRPDMKLILAHAGWAAGPEVIGRLMESHPNIHADLSVRLDPAEGFPADGSGRPAIQNSISILDGNGRLLPAWRALIERFPARFLFAMDITGAERPLYIRELMSTGRTALEDLPRDVEAAVAHGNAERLLQGCVIRTGA